MLTPVAGVCERVPECVCVLGPPSSAGLPAMGQGTVVPSWPAHRSAAWPTDPSPGHTPMTLQHSALWAGPLWELAASLLRMLAEGPAAHRGAGSVVYQPQNGC